MVLGLLVLAGLNTIYPPDATVVAAPVLEPESAGVQEPEPVLAEIRYPVSMAALREEFLDTGSFTLAVPALGELTITGQGHNPTAHGNRSMDIPHLSIQGQTLEYPGSTANVLLGEYGVYGDVEVPVPGFQEPLVFQFDAVEAGIWGIYDVRVRLTTEDPGIMAASTTAVNGTTVPDVSWLVHLLGGQDVPNPLAPTMQTSSSSTTYRDDDNEQDTWYDFDYSDDVARKRLVLPSNALDDAAGAELHVLARAAYCGGGDTPHRLLVNGVLQESYNACFIFPTSAFQWWSFPVPVNSLAAGTTNTFEIKDAGSNWNDRDHHFAMDTDTDFGRSDAEANGNDKPGELMWYLTVSVDSNSRPWACFSVDPERGSSETVFHVDAWCSGDEETPHEDLQVRWDWTNDGVYDTSYTKTKTASHEYNIGGYKTITLQVRDAGGATDKHSQTVIVEDDRDPDCRSPSKSTAPKSQDTAHSSTSHHAPRPPNPCQSNPDCSGGNAVSWVTYHAEQGFTQAVANWRDRILTAVEGYQPMWQNLCITLRPWPMDAGENILTSSSCESNPVTSQYSEWLETTWVNSPTFYDDDAYQLWTHRDLWAYGDGWNEAYCFGLAVSNSVDVGRTAPTFEAASVVEGVDFHCCGDTYDPDEMHERGIVSGHEMAHVYGEENHPYHCSSWSWGMRDNCNIMRNCKDPGRRDLEFTDGSKREIMFWYHYGREYDSGFEGMPACP